MKNYSLLKEPIPSLTKALSRAVKTKWYGLRLNAGADTGYITAGENFIITSDGTLRAADRPSKYDVDGTSGTPLSFCGLCDRLYYVWRKKNTSTDDENTYTTYIKDVTPGDVGDSIKIAADDLSDADTVKRRCLAIYNMWMDGGNVVSGKYSTRILIYPDKLVLNSDKATVDTISRYKIMEKTAVTKTITEYIYNGNYIYDDTKQGSEDDKWIIEEDGSSVSGKQYDGKSTSINTENNEVLYGYSDEQSDEFIPDTRTNESEEAYYETFTTQGSQGNTIYYLKKTTTITTTSVTYTIVEDDSSDNVLPDADIVTSLNGRVFGCGGAKIFSSAAGSYVNYDLDTPGHISGENAWYCATQNGGDFTHITTYSGNIVAFKHDMLYELYGTSNPFRVKEISHIGTFNGKTVQELDSCLVYASRDGIYAYSGSYPRKISEGIFGTSNLKDGTCQNGASGVVDGKYYIRLPLKSEDGHPIMVFDSGTSTWSVLDIGADIDFMATVSGRLYAVTPNGDMYLINTGDKDETKWYVETPVATDGTANAKNLEKVQLLCKFYGKGSITVKIKYDNGDYKEIGTLGKDSTGVYPFYCKTAKSDHIVRYIRLEIEGDVEILNLEQIISTGGERYA